MTSLRKQLLLWLLPIYLVVALVEGTWTYVMYGRMTDQFMDNQLRVLADSHAQSSGPAPAMRPLSGHNVEKGRPDRADLGS